MPSPPPNLPNRAVTALRGDNAQKLQFAQELSQLSAAANEDQPLQAFYIALQDAIFGAYLTTASADLAAPYNEIWQQIITAVTSN